MDFKTNMALTVLPQDWIPKGTFSRVLNPPPKNRWGQGPPKSWVFKCPYCKNNITGKKSVIRHIYSKKHQKNVNKFIEDPSNQKSRFYKQTQAIKIHSRLSGDTFITEVKSYWIPPELAVKISYPITIFNLSLREGRLSIPKKIQDNWDNFPIMLYQKSHFIKKMAETWPVMQIKYAGGYIVYDYEKRKKTQAINKISDWFLEVRYNPKYKYCRDKQWKELEEIYEGDY